MSKLGCITSLAILILYCITEHAATAPLFLQAITSALATIPFTGGPMTTGLVGAKLAIGTKLLYYLGFFGRRSKPAPLIPAPSKPAGKAGGLQAVPLPYVLSGAGGLQQMGGFGGPGGQAIGAGGLQQMGGFGGPGGQAFGAGGPQQMGGFGGPGFGAGGFQQLGGGFGGPGFGAGGFRPMGGGFGGPVNGGGFQQAPFGNFDPAQLFSALRAQGYDPDTAMQLLNYGSNGDFNMGGGGFMNGGGLAPSGMDSSNIPQEGQLPSFQPGQGFEGIQDETFSHQPPVGTEGEPNNQGNESDDIESFFTFLRDMDENTCISRLMCDIGANPSFLGEFSENIHGIVGSLDVQPTSGAYPYMEIMETGRKENGCDDRFPQCSDAAYDIVKNVAPSVGVPPNLNSAAINQL